MNKKVLMLLLAALLIASIAAIVVEKSIASKGKAAKTVTVEIMVASKKIERGALLTAQDVAWKPFPESALFPGIVKKPAAGKEADLKVYNKTLLRDINMGEPVTTTALLMDIEGGSSNLSSKLASGMRAVGINVKSSAVAGGFIAPGDYVDVVLTYQMRLTGDAAKYANSVVQKYASETVLQRARVLAVDLNSKEKGYQPKAAKTVTLEVDAQGAEILAISEKLGSITLALRRMGEVDVKGAPEIAPVTDVSNSKIMNMLKKKLHNPDNGASIRIYSGSQAVDVPLGGYANE